MENTQLQEIGLKQNGTSGKQKIFVPFLIALIGSLILVAAFFLPYASAIDDRKELLESHSQELYFEEIGMTNGDAINISLFEFARIYSAAAEAGQSEAVGITCVVMIALIGLFSLLSLLGAILKKPVLIMVFTLLTFGVSNLLNWDFQDRGVMPSSSYDWGASYYIYYIGAAILLIGAIWMLVVKIKMKKQKKAIESADA